MTPEQLEKVNAWYLLTQEISTLKANPIFEQLAELSKKEAVARAAIQQELFGDVIGTHREELPNGYKLKCVRRETTKFSLPHDELIDALEKIENSDPSGRHFVDNIAKVNYEFSVTGYKTAPPHIQAQFDAIIVKKPAAPSFEIEAPE